jgi:hypothetical protein
VPGREIRQEGAVQRERRDDQKRRRLRWLAAERQKPESRHVEDNAMRRGPGEFAPLFAEDGPGEIGPSFHPARAQSEGGAERIPAGWSHGLAPCNGTAATLLRIVIEKKRDERPGRDLERETVVEPCLRRRAEGARQIPVREKRSHGVREAPETS